MTLPLQVVAHLAVFGLLSSAICFNAEAAIDDSTSMSIDDLRFASQIETTLLSNFKGSLTPSAATRASFTGATEQTCAALDLNTFLHQFNPRELLGELRQSLLSGVQSEVSNFLVALAYSAPTLASALEMTDRQLHARYSSFAQTCANQQSRALSAQNSDRRFAKASDQCYAREISRGAAPTDAYRSCALALGFTSPALPATLTTLDFLRQHSDLEITPHIQLLLNLLPDERIEAGTYQVRPPKTTVRELFETLRERSRVALAQLIQGGAVAEIPECATDAAEGPDGSACLPRAAFGVVTTPAFRGARLLGPAALSIFRDALASQIATTAVYSDLLELGQQITGMNLQGGSGASASELLSRQRTLRNHISRLLDQADLQFRLEQSKLRLARTQLAALERSRVDLQRSSEALHEQTDSPSFSLGALLRLFVERN